MVSSLFRLPLRFPSRRLPRQYPLCLTSKTCTSKLSTSARHNEIDDLELEDDIPDFGSYSVILPPEPYVYGTAHIPLRSVPNTIVRPQYVGAPKDAPRDGDPWAGDGRIILGSPEERKLRAAALLAKEVLNYAGSLVRPGLTTEALDVAIHERILSAGAYPSPLRYSGFPKSCCTSVNNIIAHGIPDSRPLENGDIVNVDITVYLDGYHGDTSRTFCVGDVDEQGKDLVEATVGALEAGINACGPGKPFRNIGRAIHDFLRHKPHPFQYHTSPLFTGHGIGTVFHRPPWIIHELNDEPGMMQPGHVFTIEPCVVQGDGPAGGFVWADGWTASTENCARSAQAEHMILITHDGIDVLTR